MLVPEHFAGRLRELRTARGWSQKQLADAAGLALRAVTYLESGERKPAWETTLALCNALGVDCTAFTQAPAPHEPPHRGRPRKDQAEAPPPGKAPGKPATGRTAGQAGQGSGAKGKARKGKGES